MQIIIDNRDTENIHIDTYQMLTGDSADEMTLYNENETLHETNPNAPDLTYDDYDWEYNHKQIVEDFAHASIQIITQAIAYTEYAKIITNIKYLASGSPKFYNFTTDWYTAEYTADTVALHNYIAANYDAILEKAKKYDDYIRTNEVSKDNLAHAAIVHILDNVITADDYNMAMWKKETEIYDENTTYNIKKHHHEKHHSHL